MSAVETANSILARLVIPEVDRSLALMDRDPTSPTYGSMDRSYWYYRTLTNFRAAIWQQPMVAFAALYVTVDDLNPFFGNVALRDAAQAALGAWCRAQHRSGAFDEWYRNEHSYCPTAITGAGAVVSLHLLRDHIDEPIRRQALDAAKAAGTWLAERYNPAVMNQNLASAVMLAGVAELTEDRSWRSLATNLLARIARDQSPEGWFPEYGGFDFGYSTLALDFLALASGFGLADLADPMAERLIDFLLEVTEPGCAVPGKIGSRGTSHVFPAGAIMLADRSSGAARLASRLLHLHAINLAPRPADVDDRYFCYFYFPAFALAYRAACLHRNTALDTLEPVTTVREFSRQDSGLAGQRTGTTMVVMNRRLGGAAAILRNGLSAQYHLGYTLKAANGSRYSSAGWKLQQSTPNQNDPTALSARATFNKVSSGQPLDWLTIPFQIVVHLLVTSRLAEAFQSVVKKTMIAPKGSFPLELQRIVAVTQGGVSIRDRLSPTGTRPVKDIDVTTEIAMHSPSARQDRGNVFSMDKTLRRRVAAELSAGRQAVLVWSFPLAASDSAPKVQLEGSGE
jgi:hypothetical protein